MKSKILNYIDFEMVNTLLEGFNKSTGFVTAIEDLEGNILSQSGWREVCTGFHRKNPETAKECKISDLELANEISIDQKFHFYKCRNGLIDAVVRIVINDEHIANLFTGQFFFEEMDVSFFKKQAKTYGFDENSYLEALAKVPVFSKERAEAVIDFLLNITQIIVKMTHEKLYQIEINEEIEKSKEELIHSRDLMRYIIEHNRSAVAVHDRDLNYLYVSQRYLDDYNVKEKDIIGKHHYDVFPDLPQKWRDVHQKALQGETSSAEKDAYIREDGTVDWTRWECRPWYEADGSIGGIIVYTEVITERIKSEARLIYLSYHDDLTGFYNRRFFEEELKRIDTQKNLPLSIIMTDINGLKLVNDSFGNGFGDELLKKAAVTMKKACREEDIIARIGGDEFAIILCNTTAEETLQVANNIKELASNENVANITLSISYGQDTKIDDKQSIIEIVANAENQMYKHKLYERSSMRSKTIDLIMNTLFEKSNRELLHSKRVSAICKAIASKMNLNNDVVNQLGIAGLIHDIGKIGVDEKILNKPGMLTDGERKDIEKHPEIGWRLLSSTDEFSELGQFVLNHHEKWDGSGYPSGLKGDTIPLEARIIVVADAYDAMTSERTYRKGISKEEAIEELNRCSGTHFDPIIIDVFVNQVLSDYKNFDNT